MPKLPQDLLSSQLGIRSLRTGASNWQGMMAQKCTLYQYVYELSPKIFADVPQMSDPKNAELSHEVHRVGYHFSSIVVENACLSLGVTLTESGRVLQSSFATLNEELPTRHGKKVKTKGKTKGRASPAKFDLSQSQATIDTQAREAIRDLFPKIPDADLHETVSRSFQKVGIMFLWSVDLMMLMGTGSRLGWDIERSFAGASSASSRPGPHSTYPYTIRSVAKAHAMGRCSQTS